MVPDNLKDTVSREGPGGPSTEDRCEPLGGLQEQLQQQVQQL